MRLGFDPDGAAMLFDEGLGQRETQTGRRLCGAWGGASAVRASGVIKQVEQLWQFLRRQTFAGIRDGDLYQPLRSECRDGHPSIGNRIIERPIEQGIEDLFPAGSGPTDEGEIRLPPRLELDP